MITESMSKTLEDNFGCVGEHIAMVELTFYNEIMKQFCSQISVTLKGKSLTEVLLSLINSGTCQRFWTILCLLT